jgi:Uncharacterized protein related to plant photosystem II stability/assembly factor
MQLSATEWVKQNPLPLSASLTNEYFLNMTSVGFFDSLQGFVGSNAGNSLLYTSSGGKTWTLQKIDSTTSIQSIQVFPNGAGFIVGIGTGIGTGGMLGNTVNSTTVRHLTSYGDAWHDTTIENLDYRGSCFKNVKYGWIAGCIDSIVYGPYWISNQQIPYLFSTTDSSKSWVRKDTLPTSGFNRIYFLDTLHGWLLAPSILYSTVNGGKNWKSRSFQGYVLNDVCFSDTLNGWMVGSNLLHTIDGGKTWAEQLANISLQQRIVFSNAQNAYVLLSDNRVLFSRDNGNTWAFEYRVHAQGLGSIYGMDFLTPTCGWVVGNSGIVLKTSDDPTMLIPKLSAYQGKPFSFTYTPYGDFPNYTYQLTFPKDMSVNSGGTISWTPQTDSLYQQLVNLIVTNGQGRLDSIAFLINVNPDLAPFTKIANTVSKKTMMLSISHFGKNGIEIAFPGNAISAEVLDLNGRMVLKSGILSFKSGISTFRFESLSRGCHVLRITTGSGNSVRQLLQRF